MITINFTNEPNFDEIAKAGITMICDKNMNLQISEEDYKRLENEFEAAYMDSFIVKAEDVKTYHCKIVDGEGYEHGMFYTKEDADEHIALLKEGDNEDGVCNTYEVIDLTIGEETRYRLGGEIKGWRMIQGMTQKDLAEKCGMVQPNIARIEAGTYATSIDVLSRIAEALGKRIELV